LKAKLQELKEIEVQLNETPDKQISLTDPDARSMKTRGTGMVGYSMWAAVDAKHHRIVTHKVTNDGVDRDQLSSTNALSAGSRYSPMTSQNFSSKFGSLDSLKVRVRCGFMSFAAPMRWTLAGEIPATRAVLRQLQRG
jgi:hypothetical protein